MTQSLIELNIGTEKYGPEPEIYSGGNGENLKIKHQFPEILNRPCYYFLKFFVYLSKFYSVVV